jgi:hypothetical protein
MRAAAVLLGLVLTQGSGPLPDPQAFLQEVRENLSRSQRLAHTYAYKERRADFHINPFGRMGKGDTRVTQVYPAPNPQLTHRRIIERNGEPVTAEDLARQDAEYRLNAEPVLRRLARENTEDRLERERDEALARRRAEMMIADVVDTLKFEVLRREVRSGVPAIVVGFAARPEARPNTRQGRVAKVFRGRVWIHEGAREVMHVEAVATDDVSFGGFVAKLYEGTEASLDRHEIDPGIWMPTRMQLGGEVRALFRKTKLDILVEWFDYQKMATSAPVRTK